MQYKGFVAKCFYASEAGVFVGEVINTPAVIAFSAMTMASLQEAMIEAVEGYVIPVNTDSRTLTSINSCPALLPSAIPKLAYHHHTGLQNYE